VNVQELRKNIGNLYRVRPAPWRIDDGGSRLEHVDDSWRLDAVDTAPARIRLVNVSTGHNVELEADNIIERRSPDFLMLRCQLMLRTSRVDIEPIFRGSPVLPDLPQTRFVSQPRPPAADSPRSPVAWDFEQAVSPQQWADTLFEFGSGTAGFWITYFRISGQNVSSESLSDVVAEILPQILGERVRLQFELGPNERVDTAQYVIEAGASFVLAAPVPSPAHDHGSHGYTVEHYLRRIGGFEFLFRADQVRYARSFRLADVKEMIESAERRYGPPPPTPRLRRE
jgi:hypothetical protein